MSDLPVYILEREFDAPSRLVWRAWTEPGLFARWYGPNAETVLHRFEPRAGGQLLLEMRWGEKSAFQRGDFLEAEPDRHLVWLHSSTDAEWNVTPSPMMPDWPRTLLTDVTFAEKNGRTHMRLTWVPHEATAAEIACFAENLKGLDRGWGAGMKLLEEVLAELQD
jgi:uncharacterized protein YndB with AHSA1/START domain